MGRAGGSWEQQALGDGRADALQARGARGRSSRRAGGRCAEAGARKQARGSRRAEAGARKQARVRAERAGQGWMGGRQA